MFLSTAIHHGIPLGLEVADTIYSCHVSLFLFYILYFWMCLCGYLNKGANCFVYYQVCFQCCYEASKSPEVRLLLCSDAFLRCDDNPLLLSCKFLFLFSWLFGTRKFWFPNCFCFLKVRNTGSWLEIGQSISHFGIMSAQVVFVLLLFAITDVYTRDLLVFHQEQIKSVWLCYLHFFLTEFIFFVGHQNFRIVFLKWA